MKFALPTNDGKSLSPHFGRSAGFMVFTVENGRVSSGEFRPNDMQHDHAPRAQEHGHPGGGHDHNALLDALSDCSTVICSGIGHRAAAALQAGGLDVVVTSATGALEALVAERLAGALPVAKEGFCACRH